MKVESKGIGKKKKDIVTVPKEKWEQTRISASQVIASEQTLNTFEKNIGKSGLLAEIRELRKDSVEKRNENLCLSMKVNKLECKVKRFEKVLNNNPDIAEMFAKAEKQMTKTLPKNRELGR